MLALKRSASGVPLAAGSSHKGKTRSEELSSAGLEQGKYHRTASLQPAHCKLARKHHFLGAGAADNFLKRR